MKIKKKICYKLKKKARELKIRLLAYIKRLLFPLYLFPFKLVTYSVYYLVRACLRFIAKTFKFIFHCLIWPFRAKVNFFRTVFWGLIFTYFVFTEVRFLSLVERYGGYEKYFCSEWLTTGRLKNSVVRIVGGYSEGTGFFVDSDKVLTNFHVIDGEPSPKVIFPDGHFTTPIAITANKNADLALLYLSELHENKVMDFINTETLKTNEPILAAGYPLGTELPGEVTIVKGHFVSRRSSTQAVADYLQTDMSLVPGMSGGPSVDQCGNVIGVNTMSLAGLSLIVSSDSVYEQETLFSDQDIQKINVDPSLSPTDAVKAFYTYLKARRMQDGFNLLSREYLQKTDFSEWTGRFTDILDVTIYLAKEVKGKPDSVFVKFSTNNWVNGEAVMHYYEGTWQTVPEDGIYKMNRSNIEEVQNPDWSWFYDI